MELPLNIAPSIAFGGLLYLLIFRLAIIILPATTCRMLSAPKNKPCNTCPTISD